jgi:hypothetical protein
MTICVGGQRTRLCVKLNLIAGLQICLYYLWSWDSAVGIATSYGLDDRGVGVRVLVG